MSVMAAAWSLSRLGGRTQAMSPTGSLLRAQWVLVNCEAGHSSACGEGSA